MVDVIDELSRLPRTTRDAGPPPDEIRGRARRRLFRRRALVSGITLVVLVTCVALAPTLDRGPRRETVHAGPGTVDQPATSAEPASTQKPPAPALTIEPNKTQDDGATVVVRGYGLPVAAEVLVRECIGTSFTEAEDTCDQARSRTITTSSPGPAGQFETTFVVYRDIFTYRSTTAGGAGATWSQCEPCLIVASAPGQPAAITPVTFDSTRSTHPTVRIVEPGPHRPGQLVTLTGTGFQPNGLAPTVGWCATADLRGAPSDCSFPLEGFRVLIDGSGSFRLPDFPLPPGGFSTLGGVECQSRPGACSLGETPVEGSDFLFLVPLDLSG